MCSWSTAGKDTSSAPGKSQAPNPASHWAAREHDSMFWGLSFPTWKVGSLQRGQG